MSHYDRNQGGSQQQNYHSGSRRDEMSDIKTALEDKGTIKWFFPDNKQDLRPALLGAEAETRAKKMKEIKTSQIRRFYAPVVAFRQRLNIDNNISDLEIQAQIQLMRANAAYAGARKQPIELVRFFTNVAASVFNRKDYDAFARHFECVIAYHRVFGEEKEGN